MITTIAVSAAIIAACISFRDVRRYEEETARARSTNDMARDSLSIDTVADHVAKRS